MTKYAMDEYNRGFNDGYSQAKKEFKTPKGEWQPIGIASNDIKCSKCGCIAFNYHPTPFCPNCGADMRNNYNDSK